MHDAKPAVLKGIENKLHFSKTAYLYKPRALPHGKALFFYLEYYMQLFAL